MLSTYAQKSFSRGRDCLCGHGLGKGFSMTHMYFTTEAELIGLVSWMLRYHLNLWLIHRRYACKFYQMEWDIVTKTRLLLSASTPLKSKNLTRCIEVLYTFYGVVRSRLCFPILTDGFIWIRCSNEIFAERAIFTQLAISIPMLAVSRVVHGVSGLLRLQIFKVLGTVVKTKRKVLDFEKYANSQ